MESGRLWVIVLAAGEGQRVRTLTVDSEGHFVPKQFCPLEGGDSMLRCAVRRAERMTSSDQVVAVVAERHRAWWERDLADLPQEGIVVQPENRGTAVGILLPLTAILHRDPEARILVLPSDHHVDDEDVLHEAMCRAVLLADAWDDRLVVLGMEPPEFASEYGWIVPDEPLGQGPVRRVAVFVEKPDSRTARRLMRDGGLLNSMIFVADGTTLLQLYESVAPWLLRGFRDIDFDSPNSAAAVRHLYRGLPACDFSREILERCTDRLSVLPVPDCGWVDLGTPVRLKLFRARHHLQPAGASEVVPPGSWFG